MKIIQISQSLSETPFERCCNNIDNRTYKQSNSIARFVSNNYGLPEFDQVQLSIYSQEVNLYELFKKHFGLPWLDDRKNLWCFTVNNVPKEHSDKIYLGRYEFYGYRIVRFEGNYYLWSSLSSLSNNILPELYRTIKINLKLVEIKWDLSLPRISYEVAEKKLCFHKIIKLDLK